jgi:hypothetical protein
MAQWKEILLSGSDAEIGSLSVDNSITGSIFSGSQFSGSFSGSFQGNGSGLTDVPTTIKVYSGSTQATGITRIEITGSTTDLQITGDDNEIAQISIEGGSGGTYSNSSLTPIDFPNEDNPNIPAGSSFTNKTFSEMMDLMLYPELNPTLSNPSNTLSISPSGFQEIKDTITITLSATFSKGSISPAYGTTGFRSGDPNEYNYSGTGVSDNPSTSLTDSETISNYEIQSGANTWGGSVDYDAGPQPKTSKDNNFGSALPAGTTSTISKTITGVYPVWATKNSITSTNKLTLQSMSSLIEVTMAAENDSGDKQILEVPTGFSTITGLQEYNPNTGQWQTAPFSTFTNNGTITHNDPQGNSVNYTQYEHNGTKTGQRDLRFLV